MTAGVSLPICAERATRLSLLKVSTDPYQLPTMLAQPSPRPPPPVPAAVAPAPLPRTGSAEARCRSGADSRTRLGLDSPQPRSRSLRMGQTPQLGSSRPHARAAPARLPPRPRGASSLALHAPPGSGQLGTNKSVTDYQRVADVDDVGPTAPVPRRLPPRRRPRPHRHHTTAAKVRGSLRPKRARGARTQIYFFKSGSMHRTTCRPSADPPPPA